VFRGGLFENRDPLVFFTLPRIKEAQNYGPVLGAALKFIPGIAIGYGIGRFLGYFGPLTAVHTLYVEKGEIDFGSSNLPKWKRDELRGLFAGNLRARGTFSIMPNGTVWIARTIPIRLHQPIKNIICA
jgi:hypothetical protein